MIIIKLYNSLLSINTKINKIVLILPRILPKKSILHQPKNKFRDDQIETPRKLLSGSTSRKPRIILQIKTRLRMLTPRHPDFFSTKTLHTQPTCQKSINNSSTLGVKKLTWPNICFNTFPTLFFSHSRLFRTSSPLLFYFFVSSFFSFPS